MTELISKQIIQAAVICYLVVILAMIIDLGSGIYKAFLRGDARKSEALKRTGYKFILYIGSMLIATGVDMMIYISKIFFLLGLDIAVTVPFVTILLGIFWCIVEFWSVREKADEKTHSNISKVEKLAQGVFNREELVNILAEAFAKAAKK